MEKLILYIMVISLIFTTGCITQTSEKNLYVNSEYDFTIQLPIGYELMGDNTIAPDGGFDNVFLFYPKGFTNTLIKPRIDISVYEGTQFEITEEKGFSILSDEDLEINGYAAKKYVSDVWLEATEPSECTTYRISNNGYIYNFSQLPCKNTKLLEDVVMSFGVEE